ncbi:MAG: hypothetical protein QF714_11915 [Dehalococcoidia bacterium]|jgi:hypothetical protein|nr:hypothetical protein [Dehalococcoidia bacterium]MDP6228388.1 hypothetical protein [Dehalococcoidia bacterium]MDP7085096.1 hypothetical protein [Dehalococcoidia bacterium]MDP7199983.1 hypothetical protein [Dehalococcoidia bacterium]MDP7509962.1 hypothetical protein [Dehalococcoidia bacterium]|tara:strand:+ start:1412 stop:1696 length:285 start_codon:yes stop_codon:yes gene_type:complete
MFTLEVLNPVAQSEGEIKVSGTARRPRSLDGLTLGLLWNSKRGGEIALVKAGELISNRFKDVKVIRYDGSMPCDKELMERAKQECDVFIGSTGD